LDDGCPRGLRLLSLEDHRALRGSRRARRRPERDAARGLPRDAVLLPRHDESVRVHEGAEAAQDRSQGIALPRRLPVREAALLVRNIANPQSISTTTKAKASRPTVLRPGQK